MEAKTQDKTTGIPRLLYLYLGKNKVSFSTKNCQPIHSTKYTFNILKQQSHMSVCNTLFHFFCTSITVQSQLL